MSAGRAGQVGPENSGGPFVAYMDGKPVEMAREPIQFTVAHMEGGEFVPDMPDYSVGGVLAEEASAAMATASKVWADLSITIEVAAEGMNTSKRRPKRPQLQSGPTP